MSAPDEPAGEPGPEPGSEPPYLVGLLLRILLPEAEREFYMGDLRESGRRGWFRELAGVLVLRFSRRGWPPGPRSAPAPGPRIDHLIHDLRLGIRQLVRTPGTTLTALLALSIGIGLAGMMFSLITGGLLPTLPIPNGERAVQVRSEDFTPTTPDLYSYWTERQTSFEGLGASTTRPVSLIVDGAGGEPLSGARLDLESLRLLAVEPIMGRSFAEGDAIPGAFQVALIGYDVWQARLDGDPAAVGRTIRMNGEAATVIGVMPEGFGFPFNAQIWTPLNVHSYEAGDRREGLRVWGVLREGASPATAAVDLNTLAAELPRAASDPEPDAVVVHGYTNILVPSQGTYILAGLMVAIAVLVLMVAGGNVTNVLLARVSVRAREVAVRTALGASRGRIALQFWTEASVLALTGTVGGAVAAWLGVSRVRDSANVAEMPYWFDLRIDGSVLLFIAGSAVVAAMAAGVLPAVYAARPGSHDLLKDASRGSSSRRLGTMMGRLVGVQLTVSFVLLVGSGLFIRSALNLENHDFPFAPEGVYTATVQLPDATYRTVEDRLGLIEALEERLRRIPGASSMTLATVLPGIGHRRVRVAVEGAQDAEAQRPTSARAQVAPGFFETFRAPVISGRTFGRGDRAGTLPVAIVNNAFERFHLPNGAVGSRIAFPTGEGEPVWHTIVGVVPDFLAPGIDPEHPMEVAYLPLAQDPPVAMTLSVRASGPAAALAGPIREATAEVDPDVALSIMRPLDEALLAANASYIWLGALFVTAGGLALFLAAIGLYGVMAFWVSQRRREIGVRMAIGGSGRSIIGLVVRQGMVRIAFGLLAGMLLAIPFTWSLRRSLLDVSPFDPAVFGTVLGVLLGAGALGCILPALSATRVDPNSVLSSD